MAQREKEITEKELLELQNMLHQLEKLLESGNNREASSPSAQGPGNRQNTAVRSAQETGNIRTAVTQPAAGFPEEYSAILPHISASAAAEQTRAASVPELPEIVTLLEEIRDKLKEQADNTLYYN